MNMENPMSLKLSVLQEIEEGLETITQDDLRRAARSLVPVSNSDTVLGTMHSMEARKLWALGFRLAGEAATASVAAKFLADDEDSSTEKENESERLKEMATLCQEIFWRQTRADMGDDAWVADRIGLREDFTVVQSVKRPQMPPGLQRLLGIGFEEED